MVKYCLGALALVFLGSCTQTKELKASEKEQIVAEIREMFENYHNDIKEDGLTAEFDYLDHSSDFFWVPPGYNSALSYDSVRGILEINAKSFSEVVFEWNTLQIFPLTNEIANYSGIVAGAMMDTSGIMRKMLIIESGTVIKRPDGWKILSGQSAVLPPDSE